MGLSLLDRIHFRMIECDNRLRAVRRQIVMILRNNTDRLDRLQSWQVMELEGLLKAEARVIRNFARYDRLAKKHEAETQSLALPWNI